MSLARFYPIADSAAWTARHLRAGARLVQLRMKDADEEKVRAEAREAKAACRSVGATLILNDFWRIALEEKIDFVHLGQGDLDGADMKTILARGVRVGISTHDEAELERALSFAPDYVALGPIYPTRLKVMPFGPQGLNKIGTWKRRIGAVPLVAIGGLTPERAKLCFAAGADSCAVVTDITLNADPEARMAEWLAAA